MKTAYEKAFEKSGATRCTFQESTVGEKRGWGFAVHYNGKEYPNFVSSLVKTNKGAVRNATRYFNTGKFSLYGNAE
jgi:hypothetical protein